MPSDLERIEAKYAPDAEGFEAIAPPGTVVKLARALEMAAFCLREAHYAGDAMVAEKVLHEIAGGDDAE